MSYLSDLTAHQHANALGIIAAVKLRAWGIKAAYIAVEAALDESGMRVIASANVKASQQYPHDMLSWTSDGLGHDHASMGMFQQQTGYAWCSGPGDAMNETTMNSPNGWGTPAELMNAEKSTEKFLAALAERDWAAMTNWAAAQAVQGSAFPDGRNYQAQDARARSIVDALWSTTSPDSASAHPLTGDDDMARIVKDKKTNRRYLLVGDAPPIHVSAAGAAEYADIYGLSRTFPVVDHAALLDLDKRLKSPKSKVAAK